MKILFLLFLAASAALVCRATDGGKRAEDVVKKDTGTEFVSEGISMLEKIRDLGYFMSRSTSTIGPRQSEAGFSNIKINFYSGHDVYKTQEPVLRDFRMFMDLLNVLPSLHVQAVHAFEDLVLDRVIEKTRQKVEFTFTSPAVGGEMNFGYFDIRVNERNFYELNTMVMQGTFKTMPDWYIETISTSKKSWGRSKSDSRQYIRYVDRGITQSDIVNLFMIAAPDLTGIRQNLQIVAPS